MTEIDTPVVKLDDDEIRKFEEYFDELRQEEAKWIATALSNLAVATIVTGVISAVVTLNQNYSAALEANKSLSPQALVFPLALALCCVALSAGVYWRGRQALRKGYRND